MDACILCGNNIFTEVSDRVRDSEDHSVVKCNSCGYVQISPLPDNREFINKNQPALNIDAPTSVDELRDLQVHDTERRIKLLSELFPKNYRFLEIGSGRGFLLGRMHDLRYDILGLEVSEQMRSIAKQVTSAPLLDVDILESDQDIGTFDVILMFHLIEHLIDPIGSCVKIGKYLNDSGCLVLEVPNLDDLMLDNEAYRSFWWQRGHISYFDVLSISDVLIKSGYEVVRMNGVQRYGLENMMNWLVTGKPQIDSPSYETNGQYKWLENYYKKWLENGWWSDTLMVIAKKV